MVINNKRGAGGNTVLWIAAILVAAYLLVPQFQTSVNGMFNGSSSSSGTNTQQNLNLQTCPANGQTSVTLNTLDGLATSATAAQAEYYIFDGNSLVVSGNTGATGSATAVIVPCGKTYNAIVLNTTASAGYYATTFTIPALNAGPITFNERLNRMGTVKILSIQNPNDPSRNANITIGAGSTKQFGLQFAANLTARAYQNPTILCQVNVTSISSVSISTFSDGTPVVAGTVPRRLSATSGYVYYAWKYPKMLDPTMGTVTANGVITASSVAPSTTDSMTCVIADESTWKRASYQSLGFDSTFADTTAGFVRGVENTETLADVGSIDSSAASLSFINGGGY